MINRDSRGHSYFIVRGEILGFMKDEQLRKHLPRMFCAETSLLSGEDGDEALCVGACAPALSAAGRCGQSIFVSSSALFMPRAR